MHRRLWFATLAAASMLIGFHAPSLGPETAARRADRGIEPMLEWLDRDGDGRVGRYEGAEAFMLLVESADADEDGALTAAELSRFMTSHAHERTVEQVEFFREVDTNDDGRITHDEAPDDLHGLFVRADSNGDGHVDAAEFAELDLHDPRLMLEMEAQELFDELADGEDRIVLSDLPRDARDELTEADANQDGRLSRDEIVRFLERDLAGAEFEVRGQSAVMTGVIGPSTPGRVLELLMEHPDVDTIIMQDVPGSMDDESNLRAARLVRRHGLATTVPADGMVASGGTDFFLAGVRRSAAPGARFGVHSWGGPGAEGADRPRHDPEHRKYLEYYREMRIPETFYWFTLRAAPADDIHWMTAEELDLYDMLTSRDG